MVTSDANPGSDRHAYERVPVEGVYSSSKNSPVLDFGAYKKCYSTDRAILHFPSLSVRLRLLATGLVLIIVVLSLMHYRRARATKTLGGVLRCGADAMKPSPSVPTDVNRVRPADIKVIAAMGDSIMVGSWAPNYVDDKSIIVPGNSFAIGGDQTLKEHITLANVMREFNPSLIGASHGYGYDNTEFNVAFSGMTSLDMPRQAKELIKRMKKRKVSLTDDWKMITIFIGTNDIGKYRCKKGKEPVSGKQYRIALEEALGILRHSLNRTIVSIVSIWNSQLVYDAESLIDTGKRMECGDDYIRKRDKLTEEYRKILYALQDEKKFDHEDFTVVVQSFMDDIYDAFRNSRGVYDKSFYGADVFHISKYGNAVLGKFLWNNLLEPVGKKTTKADLGNDDAPLLCPTTDSPFIQTIGNRPQVQP
ncbi:hypothetical protein Q1695_003289 [Nippostrongylus brasiliensis]|nr:hypothetical protein Q1695_003289 [Nippostrongylus brasiliensis]